MAETSGFFDSVYDEELQDYDLKYLAEQFANYFSMFIGNGVFASPTNQLKVRAGEGLTVTVEEGWAFIDGYWYKNDSTKTLTIPPNATSQVRQDSIKCRLDYAQRKIEVLHFSGSTEVVRNGNYYDLKLAEIALPASTTQVLDSAITDTRMNESVCGFVKGLVETVNTEDLFAQYDAIFDDWFTKIKDSLGDDSATSLQNQIGLLQNLQTTVKTDLVSAINWLLANTRVDKTLSEENVAADAKAVGDVLSDVIYIVSFDPTTGTLITRSSDYVS